jgi:phosphatidylinositol kinase/protein kinase (PI-3  family)
LIDAEGHIIHIDFGFMFSSSPGGVNFESSPFKLTNEYIELMVYFFDIYKKNGEDEDIFNFYKNKMYIGMIALRNHCSEICSIIEILMEDSDLPCFEKFSMKDFRARFRETASDDEVNVYK